MVASESGFASAEVASFWRFISSSLTRLVAVLDGLDATELNWSPPARGANSLFVLALHTLSNVEENILETLCGEPVSREREAEFEAIGVSDETVRERWDAIRPRVAAALASLRSSDLDGQVQHPRRGELTGREVLIVVARHTAEHLGQAELTRDLLHEVERRR